MRGIPNPPHVGPDLLDLLVEQTPVTRCTHSPGIRNGGWTLEVDPESEHRGRWVHGDPACRLPSRLAYPEN